MLTDIQVSVNRWTGHKGVRCDIKACHQKAAYKIGGPLYLIVCERHASRYFGIREVTTSEQRS